ncbi:hypothetical protein Cpir12675_005033 [Ceratocystis pirilliformis]|uniref:Uncharacterized protein n=1 Tax=Ceratocystis pirilliformis TaxID=259994 RepID=A0ABR3YSI8_9PEZI
MHKGRLLSASVAVAVKMARKEMLQRISTTGVLLPVQLGAGTTGASRASSISTRQMQRQWKQNAWFSCMTRASAHSRRNDSSNDRDSARNKKHATTSTINTTARNNDNEDTNSSTEPKSNNGNEQDDYPFPTKSNTAESLNLGFIPLQDQADNNPRDHKAVHDNLSRNTEQQISWEAMSSDQSYLDFLNKANAPMDSASAGSQPQQASAGYNSGLLLVTPGEDIPPALARVGDLVYTSDADEPFVPVVLKWDETGNKGLPDEDEFIALVHAPPASPVSILDPSEWDGQGHYQTVLDAVREASEGADVRVYRLETSSTRVECFIVSCEGEGKNARLVGFKALAIES